VVKVGTSKAGSTISQIGCGTSVACHGKPIKEEEEGNPPLKITPKALSAILGTFANQLLKAFSS
jgi:hypothetical protein